MPTTEWLTDMGGEGFAHTYRIDGLLYDGQSPYQRVRVIENPDFGRMLVLDDAVQTTERDDFIYHELLAHVPLCTHPAPRRALIIGGGDGGLLREVLRHPVEHVTMVELDRTVVEVTRRLIPSIPGRAFEDPRTRLLIEDGIRFVAKTRESFDVAMVDSTDPKGPSLGLFAGEFYGALARLLGTSGVLAVQSGSPLYQQDVIATVRRGMGPHFRWVRTYWGTVPSYPGTLWTFTLGSQARDPAALDVAELARRMDHITTRYYTPGAHRWLFDLPPFIRAAAEGPP
ncbi:MAG: polyamine aminopropyltransferase [Armatimonadota bacterium]|nr:polyamine aminopropyltransferase [Armatimonadota bacterium]MDR7518919.1 polyamine aminopropyltransferase [Armatimonadota bacterium]